MTGDGRVFIAYDPQDAREAHDLCARLEQAGFAAWLPGRDGAGGTAEQVYAAVRAAAERSACLLLVLSGRPVDMAMLGDLTQRADAAGRPVFPIRVGPEAQVPDFPALARAKAWIDVSGPAAEQERARLAAELAAFAQRHAPAPVQQAAQPPWPPAAAVMPFPAAAPQPDYPAPPAAAPAPAYGNADWNSLEVQPGETPLGSWLVALQSSYSADVSGSLTVTDRRLLFSPKVAGTTLIGMLLSQRQGFKDDHTVVLGREHIVDVRAERRLVNTYISVTTAGGGVLAFNRGLMSADPILAALRPR
jgi:hypothetical protein